ncbi:MAG TPA: hypothetical protein VFM48_00750 [Aquabacterium sp.]|nr:hypothetical protein [Aquabacterium sp.]
MPRLSKTVFILSFMLLAALGAFAHFRFGYSHWDQSGHTYGSDDAFISYRYALNLIQGHGLVFNPGDRVEGYTNLLYTLVAAAFIWIDPNAVLPGCVVVNALAYLGTIVALYRYLKEVSSERRALFGLALLSVNPIMWAWPASGLESSVVTLVQLSLFIVAERLTRHYTTRRMIGYYVLMALAVTLRADGFVFALIFNGVFLLRKQYRLFTTTVLATALMTLAYFAARYAYYGDILPNTYYAKVTGTLPQRLGSATEQMRNLFKQTAFFLYFLPILWGAQQLAATVKSAKRISLDAIPVIPAIAFTFVAYWFYVGGDVYFERFLLILIPLSIIFVSMHANSKWLWIIAAVYLICQVTPYRADGRFRYHSSRYDRWVLLGKFLGEHHPNSSLAIDAAGKAPYYSGLPTIDMLGLNDKHIGRKPSTFGIVGHSKYDADYVLSQRPGFIAAWGNERQDMVWGLTREKYRAQGYELKYVVNSTAKSKGQDIIDVSQYSPEQITALYRQGYTYFVLGRR